MFSKQQGWGVALFFIFLSLGVSFCISNGVTTTQVLAASSQSAQIPEDSEDFKNAGNNFMTAFPEALNNAWKEAIMFWDKIGIRLREFWNQAVKERVERLIDRFNALIGKEKVIREPIIKNEFEKEKTEMKDSINKDLPPITKSIWEKLRELFSW